MLKKHYRRLHLCDEKATIVLPTANSLDLNIVGKAQKTC